MNSLREYITEKFKISKDIKNYNYFPKDKDELVHLIDSLIKERGFDADLNDINTSKITNMGYLFKDTKFKGDISEWDVSNIEYMNYMFYECENFKQDLSKWNVSKVKRWNGFSENTPLQEEKNYHLRPKFNWNNVK